MTKTNKEVKQMDKKAVSILKKHAKLQAELAHIHCNYEYLSDSATELIEDMANINHTHSVIFKVCFSELIRVEHELVCILSNHYSR